jgi:hypothetical protein
MLAPSWLLCVSKTQSEPFENHSMERVYLCLTKFVKAADPMAWLE